MKLKNTLRFILIFIIIPLTGYSQITGDWFLSHSYAPGYENDFDMSKKKMERPAIMSFSEDSIISYTWEGPKLQEIHLDYLYTGDTIFFNPIGRENEFFEVSVNADTMSLIDYYRKGSYIVLRKIEKRKKPKSISEIKDYLIGKTFQVDFSKMISMKRRNPNQPTRYDSVSFSTNGIMIVNSENQGNWDLYKINNEIYFLMHQFLFQIDSFDKKRITLISYYFDSKNKFEWDIIEKH